MMEARLAFWAGRRVFVTGASGLTGGWLVDRLLALGSEVVILKREGLQPRFRLFEETAGHLSAVVGDVADFDLLRRIMRAHGVQTVFHLAAQSQVERAREDPRGTLETNVEGTWNVLEAARVAGVQQAVVASTVKVYGAAAQGLITEDCPLDALSPYALSKACADRIACMYARSLGLPVAIARMPNLYGGGDANRDRLIPDLIQRALRGERLVLRSDGSSKCDYLYVRDAVQAYLRLAEHARQADIAGEAFHFGLGLSMSVLDLIRTVLNLMGRPDCEPVLPVASGAASTEGLTLMFATGKAQRLLGWSPEYSLEQGLIETIDWYRLHAGAHDSMAAGLAEPLRSRVGGRL